MRRENGTGTIYKIKNRPLRKPFKATVVVGYNQNGNPIRRVIGYYAKASEANEALIKYAKNKNGYELSKLTFKDVYSRWWGIHSKNIAEQTVKNYKSKYNVYLHKLDNKVFSELKTLELQDFIDTIESPVMQKAVRGVLGEIYKYAMKYEITDRNYSEYITVKKQVRKIKRRIFTKDEINTLFTNSNRISKALCILIYTGLRIHEFLKLTKNDIENGFIYVRSSKTEAGIRTIPIHDKIKNIIDEFLESTEYYLFDNKNKHMTYGIFRHAFQALMLELKMEHTIHDTRHTFASMLNSAGANDVAVISMIGHTDITTTKETYTHKQLNELIDTINLLQ